jgi:hypothetical protein
VAASCAYFSSKAFIIDRFSGFWNTGGRLEGYANDQILAGGYAA